MHDFPGNTPIRQLIPGILLAGLIVLGYMVLHMANHALGTGNRSNRDARKRRATAGINTQPA